MPPSTKIGYLDLPREIRDQIMELALHPGEVHIDADPGSLCDVIDGDGYLNTSAEPADHEEQHHYGVQLLATCRQIYEEGHNIWYANNTFYLPPCPFKEMKRILCAYQRKHLRIIGRLVVGCTIDDVSEEKIQKLKESAAACWRDLNVNKVGYGFTDSEDVKDAFEKYLAKHFSSRLETAVNNERLLKLLWLYRKVQNGHRMLIGNRRYDWDMEERVLFEVSDPHLVVVLSLTRTEVEVGTTISKRLKESDIFEGFEDTLLELITFRAEEVGDA